MLIGVLVMWNGFWLLMTCRHDALRHIEIIEGRFPVVRVGIQEPPLW